MLYFRTRQRFIQIERFFSVKEIIQFWNDKRISFELYSFVVPWLSDKCDESVVWERLLFVFENFVWIINYNDSKKVAINYISKVILRQGDLIVYVNKVLLIRSFTYNIWTKSKAIINWSEQFSTFVKAFRVLKIFF